MHIPPPLKEQLPKNPTFDWLMDRDRPAEAREVLLSRPLPEDRDWRGKLALTYFETNDYTAALEHYPHSLQDSKALFEWGLCNYYLRRWEPAIELLKRSLRLRADPGVKEWLEAAQKGLPAM